jgi:D-glycero-D-manno-heptose 1,7-bisphosphate phosphatase
MLIEIGNRFGTELTGVPCVGDSVRDLQAAAAVDAQPILVLSGKGEKTLRDGVFPANTVIFPDLAFVATALLAGD